MTTDRVARTTGALAALTGAIAVAAGAWGAHGAPMPGADWLKTGASYAIVHAVMVVSWLSGRRPSGPAVVLLAGAMLFAFSLYALALGAPRVLGMVTPVGGLTLILGWLWVAWSVLRGPSPTQSVN